MSDPLIAGERKALREVATSCLCRKARTAARTLTRVATVAKEPKVRARISAETGELLAFGSTSGGLWISENGGDSWTMPEARLPPIAAVRFAPALH